MKVLVACEYSRTVADAFLERGHQAYSNDILQSETNQRWHMQGDCEWAIRSARWDLIIVHIPCTAMGVCGNRTYGKGKPRHQERVDALNWSVRVWDAACEHSDRVVMENPARVLFPKLRKERGADVQYIQPWQFGHPEQKKTGFALHGVQRLLPTQDVYAEMMQLPRKERERIWYMSPSEDRGKERSRFYSGVADAMATQWGAL